MVDVLQQNMEEGAVPSINWESRMMMGREGFACLLAVFQSGLFVVCSNAPLSRLCSIFLLDPCWQKSVMVTPIQDVAGVRADNRSDKNSKSMLLV
jgi:hypothetical protein